MVPAPEAARVALRVRREDRTRKAVHVARDAVTSFTVVRKALLGALGTDMDIWFPLPLANARPGDDAWRRRSSEDIDAFARARVGAFAARTLAELRQEKNDGEVWDLLRELPELVVAARDAAPEEKRSAYEPVINALVAASGFALERGAPVEDLCGWVDATLGRLLPVVDRSAQLSAGYALYKLGLTPHGRSALEERPLDPDVLTPVGATLERLSRDATYDPCHPDEAHCEWRDRAHTYAFCRALASVGKALRNKLREEKLAERRGPELDRNLPSSRRERGRQRGAFLMKAVRAKRQCGDVFDVVATVCVTVARLARGWATSAAAHGLVREESPLLGRTTLYTLCRCIPLLLARKHGGSLAAAVSGFRVLACGADRVFRNRRGNRVDGNPVELLLDKGSLEVAVMSILKRGERWDRDRDELRPGYGDDDADDAGGGARRDGGPGAARDAGDRLEARDGARRRAVDGGPEPGAREAAPVRAAERPRSDEDSRSEDARERSRGLLAAAATTILLRFCSDSVPHAEELERLGSDVIAECLARALEPGRNDDVAKAALFSMQKMSARDHRLRLLFAARCAERLGELANRSRGADIQVEALRVLMNLSVALEACGAVARHALLPALEVAAASEPEVRAFAVSLLANLSRDARVCNRLHLHKLRVDYGHEAFARLTARRVADARRDGARGATAWEASYGAWLLATFDPPRTARPATAAATTTRRRRSATVGDGAPIYLIPRREVAARARRRTRAGRRGPPAARGRALAVVRAADAESARAPPSSSSSSRTDDDDEPSLATTASEAADDYTAVHLYRSTPGQDKRAKFQT
ncbi:hypothetical protein SO694_00127054 [Aureococcus anophagefferens]|uniref:Uncharacterized protein n=1 Tax=Aureococcus anophagefferens TaxID=44056 RepID=A0ABR1G391_AURAN